MLDLFDRCASSLEGPNWKGLAMGTVDAYDVIIMYLRRV
jgi:hypothetical protein